MSLIAEVKEVLPKILELIEKADIHFEKYDDEGFDIHESRSLLIQHFNDIEYKQVLLIEALMYIGQSDYVDPNKYETEYEYNNDLNEIQGLYYSPEEALEQMEKHLMNLNQPYHIVVDQMVSKRVLGRYLRQGLDVLKIKKIENTLSSWIY